MSWACNVTPAWMLVEGFFENNNKKGSEQMNDLQNATSALQPEVQLPLEVKNEGEVLVQTEAEVGKEVLAQDAPHTA